MGRTAARRNPNSWSLLLLFLFNSYALQLTHAISIWELTSGGNLLKIQVSLFGLTMCYLQGDMLEDLLFGGLNRLGGVWHNWDFFVNNYTVATLGYILNHTVLGHPENGAWRHPSQPVLTSIQETG
jgi:hypothetical protein